jgi:hypothetical protein
MLAGAPSESAVAGLGNGVFAEPGQTPKSGWRTPAFIQQRSDFNPTSV